MEHPERYEMAMFAYEQHERPVPALDATAVAPTELGVVRSMAYCLRELREGRWPK